MLARRLDEVAVRAGQRHPAVGAAVAEHDLAVVLARAGVGTQHAVVELAHLARVDALAERGRGDVVLVLAVLAVEQLRRHDDRRRAVEQRDLERQHRQVAVGQADEPLRAHPHPLAGRRAPHEVAGERAVAEVEHPLVRLEVGAGEQQRLVVDVQLHQLGVGHVDDRLAGLGEPERLLGVVDVPRLVEAVEERAVAVRLAALLGVGPHAEVAVADGEQRLGQRRGRRRRTPARRAATGRPGSGAAAGASGRAGASSAPRRPSSSARSSTTTSAPCAEQRVVAGAAVDADDEPEVAGPAGGDAGHGVLDDDGVGRRRRRAARRREEHVGRRLAGDAALGGDDAVDDDVEPMRPARRRRAPPWRSATTTRRRRRCRASASWSSSRSEPGYGAMPSRRRISWNSVVLAVAERARPCRRRAGRSGRPRAARCPATRGTSARRRSAACRRRRRGSRRR